MNIEELENKVSKYEEEIKMLKAEIAKLKEEKKPVKRWRAEKGIGKYCYMDSYGEAYICIDDYMDYDDYRYETGNYFKTKEEAENYQEKLLIYQELKGIAIELNNGEKIDWEDRTKIKYYFYKDTEDNKLYESGVYYTYELGRIYCLDKNFLEIAKERIGEERLKKLFEEE